MLHFAKYFFRFVLFVAAQSMIFNQLEVGFGIQFMIYPLFILLLPHEINIFLLLIISFVFGFSIDIISNTYGLHASSAVVLAILRSRIFKIFEPRDEYEPHLELSLKNMDFNWVFLVQGSLILLHHVWFFSLEIFKFNELLFLLQKTILSSIVSFSLCLLIQSIFFKKANSR
jgi:hypothetical protein